MEKVAIKSQQLGDLEQRQQAFEKDWKNNYVYKMYKRRLDKLVIEDGIIESEEIDNMLDRIHKAYSDLKWSYGLDV